MTTSASGTPARAWVDVDLTALVANARTVAARSGRPLLPMVKANGYGLGAAAIAGALEALDPWGFGVATPEEGAELRAAGISRPVVVFTPLQPDWIPACVEHDLRPSVGDLPSLQAWTAAGGGRPFHLEIDTGMRRAGLAWNDGPALAGAAVLLDRAAGWEGVFTHFHSAEDDLASVTGQWERFASALAALPRRPDFVHAANSAAALRGAAFAADLVRPGIYLYGGPVGPHAPEPRPVATLAARVVAVRRVLAGEPVGYGATWVAPRNTTVATLGIGYADGVLRSLGGSGVVDLGGRDVPIIGRVTMDMTLVDAGDADVAPGDRAVIFGGRIPVAEQARRAGTISYELLTALGTRVERRYGGGA